MLEVMQEWYTLPGINSGIGEVIKEATISKRHGSFCSKEVFYDG